MRVLLFGTFDRLHDGHRFVFAEAKKRGDVTVIVARDRNVTKIKGRMADEHELERMASVRQAFPEATVLLGDTSDFMAPVRAIGPDSILLGYDQQMPPGVEEKDLPCPVERLPAFRPEEFKSSLLKKRTKNQEPRSKED
jgi:FAD synthetase